MSELEKLLARYDYPLREEHIATEPAAPRDSAKLLVYDRATGTTEYDTFRNLGNYLPKGALLIFNDTKVIPARLPATLPTGGKVELLWVADGKKEHTFEALSPRTLPIGGTLTLGKMALNVLAKKESIYTLRHSGTRAAFRKTLMTLGTTPIPPYLKHTSLDEKELREKYQTVFAKRAGSVAAPTASLHFTKRLLAALKRKKFHTAYVTLHVNLGTFAPLTEKNLTEKKLHEEYYEIPPATIAAIQKAKREGRAVIPVGTTALRTLESAAAQTRAFSGLSQAVEPRGSAGAAAPDSDPKKFSDAVRNRTSLFIQEGYRFKIADGLITNFHVPRSSLLMLVSALLGLPGQGRETLLRLYTEAASRSFRFFSFGDGMLIR